MGRWTARALLGSVVLVVVLLAVAGTSAVPANPAVADSAAVSFCVEDITRPDLRSAVVTAVAELDSLDEVSATHHAGVGGCSGAETRTVRVRQVGLPANVGGVVALEEVPVVKIARSPKLYALSERERSMVVLHELLHIVLEQPSGPEWSDSHTSRCDSVLARDSACVLKLDGLTDYDREQVARKYRS